MSDSSTMSSLLQLSRDFIQQVEHIEISQEANKRARERLEQNIIELMKKQAQSQEALDIALNAIEILRNVSDDAVGTAYKMLEGNINNTLERMFENTTRKIRIHEYTRGNQYPQLELELTVSNGKKRSLKSDSGHGIAQIVSLLSILCLIVITKSRRLLVLDEVLSGISGTNREILDELLWSFTQIGFQFIINDHGYIVKGSKVYHLEMQGDISGIKNSYVSSKGVYLDTVSTDGEDAGIINEGA